LPKKEKLSELREELFFAKIRREFRANLLQLFRKEIHNETDRTAC